MKNKFKAFGCLIGLIILITLETIYKTDAFTGWMMLFSLGFGWYSAKALATKSTSEKVGR